MARGSSPNDVVFHDEFDNPPEGPVGLHRGKRAFGARFLPYIITVLVAALIALLLWMSWSGKWNDIFSKDSSSSSVAASKSSSSSSSSDSASDSSAGSSDNSSSDAASSDSTSPSSDSASSSDASASSQASAAAAVNTAAKIRVYNANGAKGLAADKMSVLTSAGFTNVTAANFSGTRPSANVVWYQSDSDKATAEAVASKLGISLVVQKTSTLSVPIEVIVVTR